MNVNLIEQFCAAECSIFEDKCVFAHTHNKYVHTPSNDSKPTSIQSTRVITRMHHKNFNSLVLIKK